MAIRRKMSDKTLPENEGHMWTLLQAYSKGKIVQMILPILALHVLLTFALDDFKSH